MFFLRRLFSLKIVRFFKQALSWDKDVELIEENQNNYLNAVDEALREWKITLNNYNFILDHDLIDYNIYLMEAAEKRYVFLLNKARKENIINAAVKITINKGDVE